MFGKARLEPHERDWATKKRLTILEEDDGPYFQLPCHLLGHEGTDRPCSVYPDRPKKCGTFRCKLLVRHESGEIGIDAALAIVRKARDLIEFVERQVGTHDVVAKLQALEGDAAHVRTLMDVGALRAFLHAEFYGQVTTAR